MKIDNIIWKFKKWVDIHPHKDLFVFFDDNLCVTEKYSYKEFFDESSKIAYALNQQRLKKNDRVLLMFTNSVGMISSLIACCRLGLIAVPGYVPSNVKSVDEKILKLITDCEPSSIITNLDLKNYAYYVHLEAREIKILYYNETSFDEFVEEDIIDFNEIVLLQYTSGSTDDPKGVIVTHNNLLSNSEFTVDHLPIAVSWLPLNHDMGLIGYYLFILLNGGTTYGTSPQTFIKNPISWLHLITKFKATTTSAPNFAFSYVLEFAKKNPQLLNSINLSSLSNMMVAAEPVSSKLFKEFKLFFRDYGLKPDALYCAYGLAENTLTVTNYGRNSVLLQLDKFKDNIVAPLKCQDTINVIEIMSCGKPIIENSVIIVEPSTCNEILDGSIGEIWVKGESKCIGYWNKPEETKHIFEASINSKQDNYLRTGDLGFIFEEELYVCGRIKDIIIIRGKNYYPSEIEKLVCSVLNFELNTVVAISVFHESTEGLLIFIATNQKSESINFDKIQQTIITNFGISVSKILLIRKGELPKTTSGKIQRSKLKEKYIRSEIKIQSYIEYSQLNSLENNIESWLEILSKEENRNLTLGTILDSLDLAIFTTDIKNYLLSKNYVSIDSIGLSVVQQLKPIDILNIINSSDFSSINLAIEDLKSKFELSNLGEINQMQEDSVLALEPFDLLQSRETQIKNILLIGSTGFFGPFLFSELLKEPHVKIYLLLRGLNIESAKEKLKETFEKSGIEVEIEKYLNDKIVIVLGDLEQPYLGLSNSMWDYLIFNIDIVYHNGALVNYIYNYSKMRGTNVLGTYEVIKFCTNGIRKELNYISTTFVFGWATLDELFESDICEDLNLLDFGYSQSKWAAEKLVLTSKILGLNTRIFRPALISPGANGKGYNFDISIRLLIFMIKHKIGVDTVNQISYTPADVAAKNIVLICKSEKTLNGVYHITRDEYCNMKDIVSIIESRLGCNFEYYNINSFLNEVIRRCEKDEMLFPLVDFLSHSVDKISEMKYKKYNNTEYKKARTLVNGIEDPPLEEVVDNILLFLKRFNLI